jgi:hypothetical protein
MDEQYLESLIGAEAAQVVLALHRQELDALRREHALERAIEAAGGRNAKAIRALMDENALAEADDPMAAATAAVNALKQENGWLFAAPQVSAPGTGALQVSKMPTMADIGRMSMQEYKQYRRGM